MMLLTPAAAPTLAAAAGRPPPACGVVAVQLQQRAALAPARRLARRSSPVATGCINCHTQAIIGVLTSPGPLQLPHRQQPGGNTDEASSRHSQQQPRLQPWAGTGPLTSWQQLQPVLAAAGGHGSAGGGSSNSGDSSSSSSSSARAPGLPPLDSLLSPLSSSSQQQQQQQQQPQPAAPSLDSHGPPPKAAAAGEAQPRRAPPDGPGDGGEDDGGVDSPGVRAALAALRWYKAALSPLLASTCRFQPTCSQYAMDSYRRFGVARGTVLTAWRLLRCNPLGPSGYDPAAWPPRGLPEQLFLRRGSAELTVVLGAAAVLRLGHALLFE